MIEKKKLKVIKKYGFGKERREKIFLRLYQKNVQTSGRRRDASFRNVTESYGCLILKMLP